VAHVNSNGLLISDFWVRFGLNIGNAKFRFLAYIEYQRQHWTGYDPI
jgi:hypothetical protein